MRNKPTRSGSQVFLGKGGRFHTVFHSHSLAATSRLDRKIAHPASGKYITKKPRYVMKLTGRGERVIRAAHNRRGFCRVTKAIAHSAARIAMTFVVFREPSGKKNS